MLKKTLLFGLTVLLLFAIVIPGYSQAKKVDLRGTNIIIGNWWADYDVNTEKPANSAAEKTLAWRTKIQKDNNFTIVEKNIASWGEMSGMTATAIMSGRPPVGLPANTLMVYVLQGDWAMALKKQNLLYPVSDRVNLRRPAPAERGLLPVEWNQSTLDAFTFKNKAYSFSIGINMSNMPIVFFNKRLFREAGLDPNILYDLQKSGQWTWDKLIEISKQLTRDINNDGIIDTYAMCRDFSTEILDAVVASNGAKYVARNTRTGKFELAINRPEFLEALQFTIRLNNEGIMKPKPDGANWDWFKAEFADGKVAMRIEDSYIWGELQNMKDDWGVVLFPKGPRERNYKIYTRENVLIIPANYKPADVDKIMYALSLWYTPQDDNWKEGWYQTFRDRRAVDETLALMRNTSLHVPKNYIFIPGLNRGAIAWEMWHHDGDPAQLVESVTPLWQALIEDVNDELGF